MNAVFSRLRGGDGARALVSVALVAAAMVITSVTLLWGMTGRSTTPPQHDGTAHGFIVARVIHTESISPRDVLVSDGSGRHQSYAYYPLGLHSSLAIAQGISSADIGHLLDTTTVFFAALVLPLSLFALTRFLLPAPALAAPFAALVGAVLSLFPYNPVRWSGIPLIVSMVLVPVSVVLVTRTITSEWSRSAAVLCSLVLVAGFAVHNSQLPLLLALVVLLVAARHVGAWSWEFVQRVGARLVWIGAISVVLLAPTLGQIVAGGSERYSFHEPGRETIDEFLGRLLTLDVYGPARQGWIACGAVVGIALLLWRRRQIVWIAAAIMIGALATVAAVSDDGFSRLVTFPWYRQAERVAYNLVFFVPVFAGFFLGLAAWGIADGLTRARSGRGPHASTRVRRRSAWTVVLAAGLVAGATIPLTVAHAIDTNRHLVRRAYTTSPVQEDSVRAFKFIARNSRSRDLVLNDPNDGSMWMYALAGARPLFALEPHNAPYLNRSWRQRVYLLTHFGELGRDARVDELVRQLRVRFVYFGETTYPGQKHTISLATLRSVPGLREVFHRGPAHVFAVSPA
ncbi:MAG: hypothetical protein E6G60_01675 [Actinobacteria bacterium]|nr:MAG: hypothetical protein E6G60_01675 [Actinomycetota bacterium]